MVRYDGQQDASTNKVSTRSANQNVSHNPLEQLYDSQPKVNKSQRCPVNSQRKTVAAKSQRNQVKVNIQPQFLSQKMQTVEIGLYGKFEVKLTKRWPKSTLVKGCGETLGQNRKTLVAFSHVWEKKNLQDDDRTNQMIRENVWWVMAKMTSNVDLYLSISQGV